MGCLPVFSQGKERENIGGRQRSASASVGVDMYCDRELSFASRIHIEPQHAHAWLRSRLPRFSMFHNSKRSAKETGIMKQKIEKHRDERERKEAKHTSARFFLSFFLSCEES